ncbi:cytosolic beta-glucosidase-like [Apostichopus japonicus]|uniref:cytosolic beta-glucosidase-like n=1 Tax=Stichopus japonicus TaxID=307972 RepID=UPI003AB190C6
MAKDIGKEKFVYEQFQDPERDAFISGTFPSDFAWGCATAAYQIEGGHDADGKGEGAWDAFCRIPDKILNGHTGDVACDSYHKIDDDVKLLKDLGVSHYRLSLSWPRILPSGFVTDVNQAGVSYYHKLLDALAAANIQPMVTIHHFDLPKALDDLGGWHNELMAVYFNQYADFCFKEFGSKVKLWITINEPKVFAVYGYDFGKFPPGWTHVGSGTYRAVSIMLKGHAMAYRTYDMKYRSTQEGQVSIAFNSFWSQPKTDSDADEAAAERFRQFELGGLAQPIFVDGDTPKSVRETIAKKSSQAGLLCSRLPPFTEEERELLKNSADFFALNYYSTRLVSNREVDPQSLLLPDIYADFDAEESFDPSFPRACSEWLYSAPWGFRKLLNWIKKNYGNVKIYITENGFSDEDGPMNLEDEDRIKYYKAHINEMLKARLLDGVDVRGYFAWSLMDNFEWAEGYRERFGLHHVDFNDPQRPRRAKASAKVYAKIVKDNGFPE